MRDRVTGQWVRRYCEFRTPIARRLPEPLNPKNHGDLLSVQLFDSVSVRGAAIRSIEPEIREGFRMW